MSDSEDSAATPAKVQKLSTSVTEVSSEADSSFTDSVTQKVLEAIDSCQNDIDALNEKASEEILQVEQKYNKLRRPHFQKRNELISSIPTFWVTAFVNHPQLASLVDKEEEACLNFVKQVDVEEFEDIKSGYKISFLFRENPYITNKVITKQFRLATINGRPTTESTPIDWKPGRNLMTRPRSHRRSRSFFTWFTETNDPFSDRVAEVIKDDLWPNPLQYYLASSADENGYTDDEDDSDDDLDDSVVVVGDDDDDDDEEEDVYEVDDEDVEEEEEGEETVESIEVGSDDDDDAVEIIESDSETDLKDALTVGSEVDTTQNEEEKEGIDDGEEVDEELEEELLNGDGDEDENTAEAEAKRDKGEEEGDMDTVKDTEADVDKEAASRDSFKADADAEVDSTESPAVEQDKSVDAGD